MNQLWYVFNKINKDFMVIVSLRNHLHCYLPTVYNFDKAKYWKNTSRCHKLSKALIMPMPMYSDSID